MVMKIYLFLFLIIFLFLSASVGAQVRWVNVDTDYSPLPTSFHVYKTSDSLDGAPFIAYYAVMNLRERSLQFLADTSMNRRLTPQQFYIKNKLPALVVNTTFFNFDKNQNLNLVINKGKLLSYNVHTMPGKGKDSLTYFHPLASAIGISKNRKADVAWLYTDSSKTYALASQYAFASQQDSLNTFDPSKKVRTDEPYGVKNKYLVSNFKKWKINTAIGGGPVLVQNGEVKVSNNEERKFGGAAINDKHPRTIMGYTADDRLIVMVIQGRSVDAGGASLTQAARLMVSLGCVEALNLDGGGSSCMLINGQHTIKVSDKEGQRAVPAVFIVH